MVEGLAGQWSPRDLGTILEPGKFSGKRKKILRKMIFLCLVSS